VRTSEHQRVRLPILFRLHPNMGRSTCDLPLCKVRFTEITRDHPRSGATNSIFVNDREGREEEGKAGISSLNSPLGSSQCRLLSDPLSFPLRQTALPLLPLPRMPGSEESAVTEPLSASKTTTQWRPASKETSRPRSTPSLCTCQVLKHRHTRLPWYSPFGRQSSSTGQVREII
jgi:hypothetical protein